MIREILDIVFPGVCLACGEKPKPLCDACVPEFSNQQDSDGTYFATELTDEVAAILETLKDRNRTALIRPLAQGLAPVIARAIEELEPTLLVCPPSSKRNYRKRGFNPSLAICKAANTSNLSATDRAIAQRFQPVDQRGLDLSARHENVAGLYRGNVSGQRVLLVDDVITTGATMSAATVALEQSQNKVVGRCALARRFLNSAHEQSN